MAASPPRDRTPRRPGRAAGRSRSAPPARSPRLPGHRTHRWPGATTAQRAGYHSLRLPREQVRRGAGLGRQPTSAPPVTRMPPTVIRTLRPDNPDYAVPDAAVPADAGPD